MLVQRTQEECIVIPAVKSYQEKDFNEALDKFFPITQE